MNNRDYSKDLGTFIKVALATGVVLVCVSTDIKSEMKYTENERAGMYKSVDYNK